MKLGNLILGIALLTASTSMAQDDDAKRECDRMLYLAQLARIERKDYRESAMYMHKAEIICNGLDQKNMDILIASIRNTQVALTDEGEKKAYADSLEAAYQRAEDKGMYNQSEDLVRAANILGTTKPDKKKADTLFKRGIATEGDKVNEGYVSYYYYNLYTIYAEAPVTDQPMIKRELISEYFRLSALAARANMSQQTLDNLANYFNYLVRSCDDILPDLKGFMSNLPQDPAAKKSQVNNFITLLEAKSCTESAEYALLIDTLIKIDPNSVETMIKKAGLLMTKKKYSEAIDTYKKILTMEIDSKLKSEVQYSIARTYYSMGSYSTAYSQAMSVTGDYRSKALVVAANSVASTAMSTGSSTFERKCNYLYAAQLLEQAGEGGGGMRAKGPTSEECFENGNPKSVSLSWGVTVNPCP